MSVIPNMEAHRTDDLALATYLRANGVRHLTMELIEYPGSDRGDQAEWVYTVTPRFKALLEDYSSGQALVEPRRYNSYLRQVRNELYAFLRLEEPPA
jgi:Domain of unknown function (DUF5659)